MINLKKLLKEKIFYIKKLNERGYDVSKLDIVFENSNKRSNLMQELQSLENERNKISKKIGIYKKEGKDISKIFIKVSEIKNKVNLLKLEEAKINKLINSFLLTIPNLPNENTPIGKTEEENILISEYANLGRGKVTNVIPHYDIAKKLDIVDFERAVKLSGTRFWAYKGQGAKLVRALENFMLNEHESRGYIEWNTPILVKSEIMQGTGQLPKFADDLFKIEGEKNLWLIPTSEVTLTNLHQNEILDLSKPISYTAYSTCFRAESGSGGKDMKGLIRSHQFNKVELVKIVSKKDYKNELNKTLQDAKNILNKLELPYQEKRLCSGDIGFASEETIDLEVWLPSENKYRETSSISGFGQFQGRRSKTSYRDENDKTQPVYTINGSALAIDRIIAAILENYQNEDNTITIPKVLVPFMDSNLID
ncbi:MAG: serine--tRNA ligase [Mollicutes bacterium PWAP]|nr:serine--tRNA ligase [Mollicutes bacterium PWAP]